MTNFSISAVWYPLWAFVVMLLVGLVWVFGNKVRMHLPLLRRSEVEPAFTNTVTIEPSRIVQHSPQEAPQPPFIYAVRMLGQPPFRDVDQALVRAPRPSWIPRNPGMPVSRIHNIENPILQVRMRVSIPNDVRARGDRKFSESPASVRLFSGCRPTSFFHKPKCHTRRIRTSL